MSKEFILINTMFLLLKKLVQRDLSTPTEDNDTAIEILHLSIKFGDLGKYIIFLLTCIVNFLQDSVSELYGQRM
jgi:hypothetical protein